MLNFFPPIKSPYETFFARSGLRTDDALADCKLIGPGRRAVWTPIEKRFAGGRTGQREIGMVEVLRM